VHGRDPRAARAHDAGVPGSGLSRTQRTRCHAWLPRSFPHTSDASLRTRSRSRIHAFECNTETFRRLRENLAGLSGIQIEQRAVFRNDTDGGLLLAQSGTRSANTGGNSVMLADDSSGVDPVPTIGLDEVLSRFDRVRLLKLDCEGAEFPALLTSQALGRVDEIVGEYHEVGEEAMSRLAPGARVQGYAAYRKEDLASKLRDGGFEVRLVPGNGGLGLFFATRRK